MITGGTTTTTSLITTPAGSCAPMWRDCRTAKCCADPGLTCFEKSPWWATCKSSCTPGIDYTEQSQYQTPWSCTVLSNVATTAMTVVGTTTTTSEDNTSPDSGSCTPTWKNCRTTKCCIDPSLTCFEKNQWWATCKSSCTPDNAWSCKVLSSIGGGRRLQSMFV